MYTENQNIVERKDAKAGFTLIEIIVAIAIVGMLLAGAFGAFRYLQTAKKSTTKSKLATLSGAIQMYKATTNQLPGRLDDLYKRPASLKGWTGDYIAGEEDLKDAWGNDFSYKANPKGSAEPYELYSYGPNGESASENEYISISNL